MSSSADEAARRRSAVTVLQIAEVTARYGASVLADGASPAEARAAALEVASELSVVADELRRLTRLRPAERRVMAAQLAALGTSKRLIGIRLGVCERAVRDYLRPGPGRGPGSP